MISRIVALCALTVREAFRQKLAVNLLIFALVLLLASTTISTLTFGEQYRIIVDLGLSGIEVFGTLIGVFLGSAVVARDVERRTAYPVLAKPVARQEYVVGRYLGLVLTLLLNLGVMAAAFALVLAAYLRGFAFLHDSPFFAVIAGQAVLLAMVAAVSTCLSTFSNSTMAAILALAVVVAGHLSSDLVSYWSQHGPAATALGWALFVVVPNLGALDLKQAMVYRDPLPASFALSGVGYGLLYCVALVALASAVFSRRDLR